MMVLAIFVYVGTEVCISSGVTTYLTSDASGNSSVTDSLKAGVGMSLRWPEDRRVIVHRTICLADPRRAVVGSVMLDWISARSCWWLPCWSPDRSG